MESEANYNENGWNACSNIPSIVNPVYLSKQIPIHIKKEAKTKLGSYYKILSKI